MPTFEFPGHGLDSHYLYSVMVYPNAPESRDRLIHATGAHHLTSGMSEGDIVTLPSDLIRQLAHSGSYEDEIKISATKAAEGMMAGDILIFLAKMKLAGYPEPSIRKAIALFEYCYGRAKNSYGQLASSSPPEIKKHLNIFYSVIHLWAAYNICNIAGTVNYIENFRIDIPKNMFRFLGVAEWFRVFAESFTPSRQQVAKAKKEVLFQKGLLYTLDVSAPIVEPIVTWDSLDGWMKDELEKYRAHQ